jgi:hypothetical protein
MPRPPRATEWVRPTLSFRSLVAVAALAITGVAVTAATTGASEDAADDAALVSESGLAEIVSPPPIEIILTNPGPFGSVSILGDSVLHGAGRYGPTLPDRLAERGWGPIRFRSGAGYSSGYFGRSPELTTTYWLEQWRQQGWEADNVIVNIGANDTEFCGTSVECSYQAIMHVVDAVGPGRRIWWPQVTKFFTNEAQAVAWNAGLERVAAERADFFTWDWPTELATGGYESNDNTHLRPVSYPKRSLRMAEDFTLQLGRAVRVGSDAAIGPPTAPGGSFATIESQRLIDTRTGSPGRQRNGSTIRLRLDDAVPPGTTAVALYVASARANRAGFVSVAPCGAASSGSTAASIASTAVLTFPGGVARGASTLVAVGDPSTTPELCVTTGGPSGVETDVIVDLTGAIVEGDDGLRLFPLDQPQRLADTRGVDGARPRPARPLVVRAPAGSQAVNVNLAATNASTDGFLQAGPCDAAPEVAALNFTVGTPMSSSSIVEVGDDGTFCVAASAAVDVIVDLTATLRAVDPERPDDGLLFVPITPVRVLDTRNGTGGWAPIHGASQTLDVRVAPGRARAVSGTLTIVSPHRRAFVTGDSCSDSTVASVNAGAWMVVSNLLTTGVADGGRLCVEASAATHTVFDATGWWSEPANAG